MTASNYSWRRLGAEVDRGTPERRTGSLTLVVATVFLTLAVAAMGILIGSYQERLERDYARVPTSYTGAGETTSEGPRWRIIDDTADGRWVHIFVVEPDTGAPLPPGLVSWPAAGEVVLSPALRGTAAGDEVLARYGSDSGQVIGSDGVVSPEERIAYVRPSADILEHVEGIPLTGYGVPYPARADQEGFFGGAAYQRSLTQALTGAGLAVVLPAIVFSLVATRSGSARRDRRLQILRAQGAGPREHLPFLWGAAGRALVAGGLGALAILTVTMVVDVPVPGAGATILARDVRSQAPLVLCSAACGWLLAVGLFVVMNRPRRLRGTRPRPAPSRPRRWTLPLLPAACLLMILALIATLSWEDASPRLLIGYAGLFLVALTLPSFIGGVTSLLAVAVTRIGRRVGRPAMIVAGRQLLHDPTAVRRLGAGMAIMVVLIGHATVLSSLTNSFTRDAQATQAAFGSSVLELSGRIDTPDQKALLDDVLADRAGVIAVMMPQDVHDPAATTALTADCPTLEALNLPCLAGTFPRMDLDPDGRVDYLVPAAWSKTVTIAVQDPLTVTGNSEAASLSVVSYDGRALPIEEMRDNLSRSMLPPPVIEPVGEAWITGLQENRDQARWNTVGAGILTVLFGFAITAAVLGDVTTHSRRTGVLSLWGAGRGFILGISIVRVLIPLLVAISTGAVVAYTTTIPYLLPPLDGDLPAGYGLTTTVLPLLAAIFITLLSAAIQATALRRWRPGRG